MSTYTVMVAFKVNVPGSGTQAASRLNARLKATVPLDENVESFTVDGPQLAEPEDVIALTLAGDDEVTDEIVAMADRILSDLQASGFSL